MSGHSKWSTIKRKKAANDAKRSKEWSKLSRFVTIAARMGGGDMATNSRLRLAVEKAKAANMPRDNIEKAIKKGTGELGAAHYEEVLYEGYGPGGVAIMCQAVTDNRARTSPEIKKIFERSGGNLGAHNSVSYLFSQKGVFAIDADGVEEERLMEIALENGGEDVTGAGGMFEVTCPPDSFGDLQTALEAAGIVPASADVTMLASSSVQPDADEARKIMRLVEALDDHEDVNSVSSNCDIPDEVMKELAQE